MSGFFVLVTFPKYPGYPYYQNRYVNKEWKKVVNPLLTSGGS